METRKKVICGNIYCDNPLLPYRIEQQTTKNRFRFCIHCLKHKKQPIDIRCANPWCGKVLRDVIWNKGQIYCNSYCKLRGLTYKSKTCAECGKVLNESNQRKYCSQKCLRIRR